MSELPPYPQPVPPGAEGPWVPPQAPPWGSPSGYPEDPLISPDYSGWWRRGVAIAKLAWRQLLLLQAVVGVLTFTVETVATTWQSFALRDIDRATTAGRDPDLGLIFAGTGLVLVAALVVVGVSLAAGVIGVIASLVAPPETASTGALIASAAVSSAFSVVIGGALRILIDPLTVAAYADMRARVEPLSTATLV